MEDKVIEIKSHDLDYIRDTLDLLIKFSLTDDLKEDSQSSIRLIDEAFKLDRNK